MAIEAKQTKKALSSTLLEVVDALKSFGYKVSEIDKIMSSLKENEHLGVEALIVEGLRLLRK